MAKVTLTEEQRKLNTLLKELRTESRDQKYRQNRLAKELNVSQAAVSQLLTGKHDISLRQYITLCQALGIEVYTNVRTNS